MKMLPTLLVYWNFIIMQLNSHNDNNCYASVGSYAEQFHCIYLNFSNARVSICCQYNCKLFFT